MNETIFNVERGLRLKIERQRLGFTQKRICDLAGTHVPTWVRYEKGQAFNTTMCDVLSGLGFDMIFVVFNQRQTASDLSESEQVLLRLYHSIDPNQYAAFMKMAQVFAQCNPLKLADV
jgi:transcriptional regulator with XRE-family HTH domain